MVRISVLIHYAGGGGGSVDAVAGTQETEFVSLVPMRELGLNNGVGQLSEGINNDGNVDIVDTIAWRNLGRHDIIILILK